MTRKQGERTEDMRKMSAALRTAVLGMLCAAAVMCSYAETLIPFSIIPVPGFKIGLANVVIMLVLYRFSFADALIVNVVRSPVIALLFSGVASAVFSLCGGTLALIAMTAIKRCRFFSIYAAGVAGAVMHNIGQLLAVAIMLKTASVFAYLPWLMLCSLVCGLLIAAITVLCSGAFERLISR